MTIPQSIAYALLAGLPPTAGLFAAIFGTLLTATMGSSKVLIAGPSTGTAILIQTAIAEVVSMQKEPMTPQALETFSLHILMQIVLIAGLIQVVAAFINVSKVLQFVSRPVMLGYFSGITLTIIVTQLFAFTGIVPPSQELSLLPKIGYFISHLLELSPVTLGLGLGSFAFLVHMRRHFPNFPNALSMIILASFCTYLIRIGLNEKVLTLHDYSLPLNPLPSFGLPWIDFSLLNQIFPAAAAIGFLAIFEVFSISRTFAHKQKEQMQINQDVLGLGVANLVLSFIRGGMLSSGSITRTALNYRLQAKTPLAAIFSALLTGLIIVYCWGAVGWIPLSTLATLLIASVHTLTNLKDIKLCFSATKEDAWVFSLTFLSCLVFTLDISFFIGILISIGTHLYRSSVPHFVEYGFNAKGRLMLINPKEESHRKVRIIGIGGDLYFATADVFEMALQPILEDPYMQVIVLRLTNVHHMDGSMCLAILHLFQTLQESNRHLVISGLTEEVWQVFHRSGLVKQIGLDNLYFTDESNPQFSTWKAALRAQDLL
jgi:SulP family sulfate permease